jgi:UDP-2,4-diacetamido-2,4,6-trideoxy-beta-L-altropyranose hydrolase
LARSPVVAGATSAVDRDQPTYQAKRSDLEGAYLLIRADADARLGTGHVMRSLALAQVWQDHGGHAVFAMSTGGPELQKRLLAEGMQVSQILARPGSSMDAEQTANLARGLHAQWIVLDGNRFNAEYQRDIKKLGPQLLVIDDTGHASEYSADIVLNYASCATEALYAKREAYTRLLLGPRYALFRREFSRWQNWKRDIPVVAGNILVTIGGGDADNVTMKIVDVLQDIDLEGLQATVVVGFTNPHYDRLRLAVSRSNVPIRLERSVEDMPSLMAWADIAITAGGGTCLELLFLATPCVVLTVAHDQVENTRLLDEAGAVVSLGWHLSAENKRIVEVLRDLCQQKKSLSQLSHVARSIFDGKGATRVLSLMMDARSGRNDLGLTISPE